MKQENKRTYFWQWDAGCILLLEEVADRVDFSVTGCEDVYSVLPSDGKVKVPDACLRTDGTLEVYTVFTPPDGHQTRTRHTFPVKPRKKPADYICTPEEFEIYHHLESELERKITRPVGGTAGQVLTKTETGEAWTFTGGTAAGATFYPHVSAEGILSWSNELGLPNPEPVDLKGVTGEDGFTPSVTVEAVEEGLKLTIINRDNVSEVILPSHATGGEGQSGATFTPHLSAEGVLSWTNDKGLTNPTPICLKGADGAHGPAGEKGETGARGEQGETGPAGADGVTPVKGVDYFTDADLSEIRSGLLPLSGGTLNGSLDLGGNRLKNTALPVDSTDAANKAYVDGRNLVFRNITVSAEAFSSDATYPDYPFKADIPLDGVTETMIPEVVFPVVDFGYAPVCESFDGGVTVYTDFVPAAPVIFPTILMIRGSSL